MAAIDWGILVIALTRHTRLRAVARPRLLYDNQYLLAGKEMPVVCDGAFDHGDAGVCGNIYLHNRTGLCGRDAFRAILFRPSDRDDLIAAKTAVPIFHRSGVYTAYEYLEKRFDVKTRLLVSMIFLISRGLAVGVTLSAPAIVLSVILEQVTRGQCS